MIDMPLNAIPPTTTVSNFNEKIEASKGQCRVDVGFWGGVIPGNEVRARVRLSAKIGWRSAAGPRARPSATVANPTRRDGLRMRP